MVVADESLGWTGAYSESVHYGLAMHDVQNLVFLELPKKPQRVHGTEPVDLNPGDHLMLARNVLLAERDVPLDLLQMRERVAMIHLALRTAGWNHTIGESHSAA
jgi:hypothetical protein